MEDNVTSTVTNQEHHEQFREGGLARPIESMTAKLPSDTFLWLAGGAILASLTLQLINKRERSLFVGQWAPTFLILGLYNKLVKVAGHDSQDNMNNFSRMTH